MKTYFHSGALVALALLAFPAVHAAYNPKIVAADARWVIYADMNSLRESTLGQELITAISQSQSQATGGVIGINFSKVLTTVGSLTAYGSNLSSDPNLIDGALIAQGTADLRKIAEGMLLQGTLAEPNVFSEVTDLPFPAYAIGDPKATAGQQPKLVIAFPPEPIVIVSKSKAQLIKAREVFRGSAPSLAGAGITPLTKPAALAEGASLFAASLVPGDAVFPENSPQTRVLQLTRSGALAFGERGSETFGHVELVASSAANAERLMKILQGLAAMLSMAESNDRELANFLNATAVTRENDTVTLRLAYPSERLVQMARMLQAKAETQPRKAQRQPITIGKTLAEWGGDAAITSASDPAEVAIRTIENVTLTQGAVITVGRAPNNAKIRFDRVEIMPADGSTPPLVFRQEYMRGLGGRGMWQFAFPGAVGVYTMKVAYMNPVDSNATFAVSVSDPKEPAPAPQVPRAKSE